MGLTVTVTHAVLVTCIIVRKVIEFSTDAQLLHVLTLPQDVIVTQWSVNDRPMGLTVTITHTVLVTCIVVCKVIEFSTDVQLLHVLTLPQDVIVTQWAVNDRPMGLAVTVTHAVLVTCIIVRKVIEFSTDAQLLHVLTLPQDIIVTQWPVNDRPMGLAITVTHSVLVTCIIVCKVKEFSTDAQLLHVLTLPQDIRPWHTMSSLLGNWIVCHND